MTVMRLQRALARAGILSRRKAEEIIVAGRVSVNGEVATLGMSVDVALDSIVVDGKPVAIASEHSWLALNKPTGVLTAASDPRGRRTVFDLVQTRAPGLTYVGRLDYMTEGLLLLTTDGDAVHALTHPRSGIEREYRVTARGDGSRAAVAMRRGVELSDGFARPRDVHAIRVDRGIWQLDIIVTEGRNREIRRLCDAVGLEVLRLVRTRYGTIRLGDLASGAVRKLTSREIATIGSIAGAKR